MQRKGERESSRELQHKSRDSTAGPSEVLRPFLNQLWWPGDEDVLTGLSWAPSSMPGAESASLGAQGLEVGEGYSAQDVLRATHSPPLQEFSADSRASLRAVLVHNLI